MLRAPSPDRLEPIMDSLPHQLRPGTDEPIECWDDDDDLQFNGDVQFRTASSAGSITNSSFRPSGHRDSISSRLSARSDLDSNVGDEDWQVPLYENDEFAKEEAIASAKTAGIPIPTDFPNRLSSAARLNACLPERPERHLLMTGQRMLSSRTPKLSYN